MTPTFTITYGDDLRVNFQMELDESNRTHHNIMVYASHSMLPEPEVVEVMVRALKPKDIAIDCGANIGWFTLLMARLVGEHGWVLAIEPDMRNVKSLITNVNLNKMMNVNVVTHPLWSLARTVTFMEREDGGESSVVSGAEANPGGELPSGLVTKWAKELDRHELSRTPKLIKIDVEGAEEQVLMGASKLLQAHPPYVIAEMNAEALEKLGGSQKTLRALMKAAGYETFLLPREGMPVHLPEGTAMLTSKLNVNFLYATLDDVGALWPELVLM